MLVTQQERKKILLQGLPFAVLPAALFIPALALFTIYGPDFGPPLMRLLAVAFTLSEIRAMFNFVRMFQWKLDALSLSSLGLSLIAALVILACIYGFIPPLRR